jgi:L-threonine-O-3-phosphate decarboxylase
VVKPRAVLAGLKVCEHGGERVATAAKQFLDFSVCLNPYGPPSVVFTAIDEAIEEISRYPETECSALREHVAAKLGCAPQEVLAGAGVSELIQLVALAFAKRRVLIPEHTYGEYETAARIMGAQITPIAMPDRRIRPELLIDALQADDLLFLCNPNNPTGQYLPRDALEGIVERAEHVDALVVLDEAYVDFVQNAFSTHTLSLANLIILRSLTKSFAIPGIRVGYAIAAAPLIAAMRAVQAPWSVSAVAQRVGAAVIGPEGDAFLAGTRRRIEQSKKQIERALDVQSDANYYVLAVGDARSMKARLLRHGMLVRDCTSFGLPAHIRFSVKKDEENERLLHVLKGKG